MSEEEKAEDVPQEAAEVSEDVEIVKEEEVEDVVEEHAEGREEAPKEHIKVEETEKTALIEGTEDATEEEGEIGLDEEYELEQEGSEEEEAEEGGPTDEEKKKEIQRRILAQFAEPEAEEEASESEEGEEEPEEVSAVLSVFDRDEYLDKYKTLNEEKSTLTLRNAILCRKMNEYFKKKKIIQIPNPIDIDPAKLEKRYQALLLVYDQAKQENEAAEAFLRLDLEETLKERKWESENFTKEFAKFVELEKSLSKTLIYATSGRRIPTEYVDRIITRQRKKVKEIAAMRYQYIKCRNIVTLSENKLDDVERLSEGLQVKDYEKMAEDNDNFLKRLEEKEVDLRKQRNRCSHYHEMIAHMKEEINCEAEKCIESEEKLLAIEIDCNNARAEFGIKKDELKVVQAKLLEERNLSGLLAYPKLHQDFKKTAKVVEKMKDEQRKILEHLEMTRQRSKPLPRPNTTGAPQGHQVRTKPKLHRSVNLGSSRCGC